MIFDDWLAQADELEKRRASDWRHHYPIQNTTWVVGEDDLDGPGREETICGCDERYSYIFGSPGHEPGDSEDITMLFDTLAQQAATDDPEFWDWKNHD